MPKIYYQLNCLISIIVHDNWFTSKYSFKNEFSLWQSNLSLRRKEKNEGLKVSARKKVLLESCNLIFRVRLWEEDSTFREKLFHDFRIFFEGRMYGRRLQHGVSEFTRRSLEDILRRNLSALEEGNKEFDNLERKFHSLKEVLTK